MAQGRRNAQGVIASMTSVSKHVLLIDNYDSFAHNLARYLRQLGQVNSVVRNDCVDVASVCRAAPSAVVLSPGPCTPQVAGNSLEVVTSLYQELPMLGVCLGHQTLAVALGAALIRAPEPMHGRTSQIVHDGRGVFADVENPISACRYHSLVIDEATLPACLEVSARSKDGLIMAIRHCELPLVGLQFHPESVLTPSGYPLLAAFLRLAGLTVSQPLPTIDDEMISTDPDVSDPRYAQPITF